MPTGLKLRGRTPAIHTTVPGGLEHPTAAETREWGRCAVTARSLGSAACGPIVSRGCGLFSLAGEVELRDESSGDDPFDDIEEPFVIGGGVGEYPEGDFAARHVVVSTATADVGEGLDEDGPRVDPLIGGPGDCSWADDELTERRIVRPNQ